MPTLENARHERFCQEYVVDLNATQAYIRAGYSPNGAEASASKLLTNPKVIERVKELQAAVTQRIELTQEKVVSDLEDLKTKAAAAGNFGPAVRATELLGKHIGMWPTKIDVAGSIALGELVKKAHKG